ncbi:hypothetical protein D3C87_1696580 [compost metagenome]
MFGDIALRRNGQLFGDTGAPEGAVDEIIAGRQLKIGGAAIRACHQRQLAVFAGNRAEHPPGETILHHVAVTGQFGAEAHILGNGALRQDG